MLIIYSSTPGIQFHRDINTHIQIQMNAGKTNGER